MGCDGLQCGVLVKNNIKYRLSDNKIPFSAAGISQFLTLDNENKLTSWSKSQEIPSEREEENVVVLVGKNFQKEVEGKNVFVFF